MANEITINTTLRWSKNGQTVSGSVSESYDQIGNGSFSNVQTIGNTTEQIDLGDVTGAKYMWLKNEATKGGSPVIWVDTVTPVVPNSGTARKLIASQCSFSVETSDTWYAISTGTPPDLGVVAVEV